MCPNSGMVWSSHEIIPRCLRIIRLTVVSDKVTGYCLVSARVRHASAISATGGKIFSTIVNVTFSWNNTFLDTLSTTWMTFGCLKIHIWIQFRICKYLLCTMIKPSFLPWKRPEDTATTCTGLAAAKTQDALASKDKPGNANKGGPPGS